MFTKFLSFPSPLLCCSPSSLLSQPRHVLPPACHVEGPGEAALGCGGHHRLHIAPTPPSAVIQSSLRPQNTCITPQAVSNSAGTFIVVLSDIISGTLMCLLLLFKCSRSSSTAESVTVISNPVQGEGLLTYSTLSPNTVDISLRIVILLCFLAFFLNIVKYYHMRLYPFKHLSFLSRYFESYTTTISCRI